jgi:PPE-repeat protein
MGSGSLSGWSEGILLSFAIILIFGLVVASFNYHYSQDYEVPIGDNNATQQFVNYIESSSSEIQGGEADTQSDAGITLKSSWGITKSIFNTIGSVLTGGFIEDIFNLMNLGEAGQIYAFYLRILFILSLVFAILYILFKVVA